MPQADDPLPQQTIAIDEPAANSAFEANLEMILDKKKPRFLKRKCTVGQGDNGPQNMIVQDVDRNEADDEQSG